MDEASKIDILEVEVCQKIDSTLLQDDIKSLAADELCVLDHVPLDTPIYSKNLKNEMAKIHIDSITCFCSYEKKNEVSLEGTDLRFHVYTLTEEEAAIETMQSNSEDLPAYAHWILPVKEFYTLWENLYFDGTIKQNLLHFVEAALTFSDCNVNPNIISCNKVVFLYGPPGTGKTSLCKALAQKITILLNDKFDHGELIEINSNSLFSKWFSESGKLVMRLFDEIRQLLQNRRSLVCILINEVESLAHVRKNCASGAEPSDAIRVVNALLTQLDQIKHFPNVVILTTSNLEEVVDVAFFDRADIKQRIDHPSPEAIYKIYSSCLKELIRVRMISDEEILEYRSVKESKDSGTVGVTVSGFLLELCYLSHGFSGRTLRRIPFLARALHLRQNSCTLVEFLHAMNKVITDSRCHKDPNVCG